MKQTFILETTADVPDDQPDLVHEAVVGTKAQAQAIVDALTTMGLANVKQQRRIGRVVGPRAAKVVPVVREAAE